MVALFHLFPLLGRILAGTVRLREKLIGKVARGKGRILLEAWAIPDSRVFAFWPLASYVNSPKVRVETYLTHLQSSFLRKNGTIFFGGGDTPRSSL
jgi:hypothetical protein